MGALRQPQLAEHIRKPPARAEATPKLNRYGRDPSSELERLRARTNYETGDGWAAFPHAAFVDMLRLASGAVCWQFIAAVNVALSSGRRSPKDAWVAWTEFKSSQEWADSCRANVRDVQRQISELQERGMIAVKQIKNGTVKYSISLLFSKWQGIEDYAIWRAAQVVPISKPRAEIKADAVRLTAKPQVVRAGRSSDVLKIETEATELSFQNNSLTVDAVFDAVVQSGRIVVSATFKTGEVKAKGEEKGKPERHPCRALPLNEGIQNTPPSEGSTISHPRAAELVKLFDPILGASHAVPLSHDLKSLQSACEAVGDCDHDFLVKFAVQRAERPVKSPLHVQAICAEALASCKASKVLTGAGLPSMDDIKGMITKERAARLGKK